MRSKYEQTWKDRENMLFHVRLNSIIPIKEGRFVLELEFIETGDIIDAVIDPEEED